MRPRDDSPASAAGPAPSRYSRLAEVEVLALRLLARGGGARPSAAGEDEALAVRAAEVHVHHDEVLLHLEDGLTELGGGERGGEGEEGTRGGEIVEGM